MFWRIWWRLLRGSRARLAVAFLAVASGATVCAALLNLQFDADRKLTREFRTLGANIIVSPRTGGSATASDATLMDAGVSGRIAKAANSPGAAVVPFLYVTALAQKAGATEISTREKPVRTILAGTDLHGLHLIAPGWKTPYVLSWEKLGEMEECVLGEAIAKHLGVEEGSYVELLIGGRAERLQVAGTITAGGSEDSQVFVQLEVAQRLADLAGQISLVQVSVPGTPHAIEQFRAKLTGALLEAEVRPIRQIAEGEGRLFSRIKGLLLATGILILVLTALCVLATMAALAMDRRRDVGLMKALGGSMRQVLRLFLLEAGSLALAGGLVGCGAGLLLSEWVGRRVFGAGVTPRLEVLPITLALMVGVSLAGAFPLRLLARVKPAVIFRGEA